MSKNINKSRIARNTILLYFRLLLTVIVGLYTSRVILEKLGVVDYGIYNVVGGIVSMLSFFNSAMIAASQRFISYELGQGDMVRLQKVFNTSVYIHTLIAVVAFVIAETAGLWFVNTYLNIPSDRMFAANCVYQSSIFVFILSIITVPFNACVIAHERMNMFAYSSIVEYLLKLIVCYIIGVTFFDRLIMYGILLLLVGIIISVVYIYYCKRNFREIEFKLSYDNQMFKEMFSFAGWNLFGNIGSSFKEQIINIVLNIFLGAKINAARGVAIQVSSVLNTLASNIAMAINPQITKQYASCNYEQSKSLVFACSKYSFYLLSLFAIPFILNINRILELWLVNVPTYTSGFFIVAIIVSLVYTLTGSISTAIQATGKIKAFQLGVCFIMLSEIPIAYILLKYDCSPVMAIAPTIVTNIAALIYRYFILTKHNGIYLWKDYLRSVVVRALLVFVIAFSICYAVKLLTPNTMMGFILSMILSVLVVLVLVYSLGITTNERIVLHKYVRNKLIR